MDLGWAVFTYASRVSLQARGFTRQVVSLPLKVWSRQAWLQPMQVLISSARSSAAFSTSSASARNGRAMETISASPSARTFSATSGILIRLVVTSGMLTSPFRWAVTLVKAPRSTERSEEHTSELQSRPHLVCRLLLEKKKKKKIYILDSM